MNNLNLIYNQNTTAREALIAINSLAIPRVALFIVDDAGKLVGSLSDGDIRRGLINGLAVEDSIAAFMNKSPRAMHEGEIEAEVLEKYLADGIRFLPLVNAQREILRLIDLTTIKALLPVDAMLMAGGKGERLRPYTDSTPKPMMLVGDKPIIAWNIDRLMNYGVSHIHIAVRHLAEQIVEGVNSRYASEKQIHFIHESEPLGTIGAVKLIPSLHNDAVLLMNADLLTNIDFGDFYQNFKTLNVDMQVATIPYHVDIPYAVMEIDQEHLVKSFREKPRYTHYSNAGIYLFKKELIDLIPAGEAFDATHFMEALLAAGKKIASYPLHGYWLDIGRPDDYLKAQEDVKHIHF